MKTRLSRIQLCCVILLLLLQVGVAQEASFRITPLRPVEELRAEALKAQPPRQQGSFREPELVELVKLDPSIKLDIRYATTRTIFWVHPCTPRRGPFFSGRRRKHWFASIAHSKLVGMD